MHEFYVIVTLAVMNVAQLVFWAIYTHKLINKIMSKNFAEYDLVTKGPPPPEKEAVGFSDYQDTLEEEEILAELNGQVMAMHK